MKLEISKASKAPSDCQFLRSELPPALLLYPLLLQRVHHSEPIHLQVKFEQSLLEFVHGCLGDLQEIRFLLGRGHLLSLYEKLVGLLTIQISSRECTLVQQTLLSK